MSHLQAEFVGAQDGQSRRLMVVLHGLGDSPAGYEWFPGAMGWPWMNYLLVRAPDPYFGGFSWFDFMGNAAPGIERSRQWLIELLQEQKGAGFPPEQTTLFGFSQGCLMVVEVGLKYPERFAGIVGVSGYIFEPQQLVNLLAPCAKEQRLLLTHGTLDPLINCQVVRRQVDILRAAGIGVEWREFMKAHTIAGQEEVDLVRDFVEAGY